MIANSKILIIGQGAIGTFLGASLSKHYEVTHYVRNVKSSRKSIALKFTDKRKKSFRASKDQVYDYKVTDYLPDIINFDYIIISVSHNVIKDLVEKINPSVGADQTLVVMGNIWNDFDWLQQRIKNPYIFAFPNFGGAIVEDQLQGWLTQNFTTGVTDLNYQKNLLNFNSILSNVGFKPLVVPDILGWLMTHFSYNAGMLLEAANQNGFGVMTKKWKSLKRMYVLIRECMQVANKLNVQTQKFKEGKSAFKPLWWNVLKTYLMFLIPGLAKGADANKDIQEWRSYGRKIFETNKLLKVQAPQLNTNFRKG